MSGRRQPQRIPPPIAHGIERIDAEPVLREYPGALGMVLWKTVRSVRLWTELTPEARRAAFAAGSHERRLALVEAATENVELRSNLRITAGVLRGDAVAEEVAEACFNISEWAFTAGGAGTALEFIQAAALADPLKALFAYRVSVYSASRGEYARAETWARQTMSAGRRTRDWKHFVYGLLSLAMIYRWRGNLPLSRKTMHRAVKVALRHSLRETAAYAYTGLLGSIEPTRTAEINRYARAALKAFGPGHHYLPGLAHNVAMTWMETGYFGPALRVFRRIPHDFARPEGRLGIAANMARAAAAAGDLQTYRETRERCEVLLKHPAARISASVSLINLARAALLAGDWDYAEGATERARLLALELGQAQEVMSAEALADALRSERLVGSRPRNDLPESPAPVEQLAEELSAALETAGAG